jgi:hypothetical protein
MALGDAVLRVQVSARVDPTAYDLVDLQVSPALDFGDEPHSGAHAVLAGDDGLDEGSAGGCLGSALLAGMGDAGWGLLGRAGLLETRGYVGHDATVLSCRRRALRAPRASVGLHSGVSWTERNIVFRIVAHWSGLTEPVMEPPQEQ